MVNLCSVNGAASGVFHASQMWVWALPARGSTIVTANPAATDAPSPLVFIRRLHADALAQCILQCDQSVISSSANPGTPRRPTPELTACCREKAGAAGGHRSALSVALCRVNVGEVLHARVQAFRRAQLA